MPSSSSVFNPLTPLGIADSEVNDVLIDKFYDQPLKVLPEPGNPFDGCGVYAIYYFGESEYYESVSDAGVPIYVGKAVPNGSRTGGAHLSVKEGRGIYKRILEHRRTLSDAKNLNLEDFRFQYLITTSMWIRYLEQLLISHHKPWWNSYIDGFGDHDPGNGRRHQERSVWDTLHPGRRWVEKHDLPKKDDSKKIWEEQIQPQIEDNWPPKEDVTPSNTEVESDLTDFV